MQAENTPPNRTDSLIGQILEHAFNQGDLDVVDEVLMPEHFAHNTNSGSPNGPEGLKWLIAMFRAGFPDLHCTIEDEIREGERFAAHWTMRGTHLGPFFGNPPTGRSIDVQGIVFARTKNGRMIVDWTLVDQMGILQQLGLVPPTRGA